MKLFAIAKAKYLRISPKKLKLLINQLCGKSYMEALNLLKLLPQKKGIILWKLIHSAISNLNNKKKIEKKNIYIKEFYINKSSILKKIQARARGRAFTIQKKYSHIIIKVSEI
jgi:large subunit ribosomal protein L22